MPFPPLSVFTAATPPPLGRDVAGKVSRLLLLGPMLFKTLFLAASHAGDPALILLAVPTRSSISCVEAEKLGIMDEVPDDAFGNWALRRAIPLSCATMGGD